MRLLTSNELRTLSRRELSDLLNEILRRLPALAEGSAERANAMSNLALVRAALAQRGSAFNHLLGLSP